MAPLFSLTYSLPGWHTLNPRHQTFPWECPVNLRVPLIPLGLSFHILIHSCSIASPLRPVTITPGRGRIHLVGLYCRLISGLQVQLDSLRALKLRGVRSTLRSLLLNPGFHRSWHWRVKKAEHQAPRVREAVEAGAVVRPRSWTLNQVGLDKEYPRHCLNVQTFHFLLVCIARSSFVQWSRREQREWQGFQPGDQRGEEEEGEERKITVHLLGERKEQLSDVRKHFHYRFYLVEQIIYLCVLPNLCLMYNTTTYCTSDSELTSDQIKYKTLSFLIWSRLTQIWTNDFLPSSLLRMFRSGPPEPAPLSFPRLQPSKAVKVMPLQANASQVDVRRGGEVVEESLNHQGQKTWQRKEPGAKKRILGVRKKRASVLEVNQETTWTKLLTTNQRHEEKI